MTTPGFQGVLPTVAEGLRASVTLNDGRSMPWLGLGVFQIPRDADAETAVRAAIDAGYRSIDTAALYHNERGVGKAVRECGVARDQLFVTTKVWNDDMRADRVDAAFGESMRKLGLDYLDLYLLHWPVAGKIAGSWRVLERLQKSGSVRSIGVSNHMVPHLEELLSGCSVVPAVNQIEYHPYLQSRELAAFCRRRGIVLEAWSPLMQAGSILRDPVLSAIAGAHGKSVAQVILRWDIQGGVATIPKSVNPRRMAENAAIFDFELSPDEMARISGLDRNRRNGADPFNFRF